MKIILQPYELKNLARELQFLNINVELTGGAIPSIRDVSADILTPPPPATPQQEAAAVIDRLIPDVRALLFNVHRLTVPSDTRPQFLELRDIADKIADRLGLEQLEDLDDPRNGDPLKGAP
jgi:hypothetical protein